MDNYERALLYARELFLKWDQEKIIARAGLSADEAYIHLDFLGMPHRLRRATGEVFRRKGEAWIPCGFGPSLSIFDYLCREEALPLPSQKICAVNSLKHSAQSSPSDVSFHRTFALRLQDHIPALRRALEDFGCEAFPQGDAACVLPVFSAFPAVFQFWEGDEEFPPSVRFLWPENALSFLKYESLYYVMGCFLDLLWDRVCEIEKNC